jgi:hypothetical protein
LQKKSHMKQCYAFILTVISLTSFAQVKFEKGYFINNQNVRTECIIKNIDWNDTPTEFEYRLSENDNSYVKKDYEVKEFVVGSSRYVSADVAIDITSDRMDRILEGKNPVFETRRIFMKVLTEGKSKLYQYKKNEFQRFFFSINGGEIQQLVYKRYFIDHNHYETAYNTYFRQQLWVNVKCETTTEKEVENLTYTKADLIRYFEAIDACKGEKTAEKPQEKKKGSFNLKASVFFGKNSFSVSGPRYDFDFGSKTYVSFGAEGEYIFPFRNNKWSCIVEPTYNTFSNEVRISEDELYSVDYKSVSIGMGFRHYFFINDNSKIFLNFSANYSIISGSSNVLYVDGVHETVYEFSPNLVNFSIGGGFNYRRFSIEARIYSRTNQSPYNGVTFSANNMALIGRYQFL